MGAIKQLMIEANDAFYAWEKAKFGDATPLSDADRLVWVHGYVEGYTQALPKKESEVNHE